MKSGWERVEGKDRQQMEDEWGDLKRGGIRWRSRSMEALLG